MDFHENLKLPADAIAQIADDTRHERADEFGVRQVELYHNPDGQVYCLLDGPDEDAIRKHHAALGVDCGVVSSTEWTASPKGAAQPGLNAARRVSQHSRAGPSAWRRTAHHGFGVRHAFVVPPWQDQTRPRELPRRYVPC